MLRPRYIIVAVLVIIVAGVVAYWRRADHDRNGGYVTAPVERAPIASIVTATGTVNPVTTVQVGTYVSGPILAIDVDYNSPVTKGQRVAKIDPAPFEVKVQKAAANRANTRAKVEKDRADLALKKLTLARNRELHVKSLISQNDLDTAQSNYDQAAAQIRLSEASVKQADAELAEAHINLAYTDITSPVDGVVVSRNVNVGQTVAASFQTPTLFLVAQDLTKMQVDANVSESDIGDVRAGQAATFSADAYPGKEFYGAVTQVRNAPITVQNVVTYDVVIEVDNSNLELKPGMTVTVIITTAQRDNALRIPLRALRFNPERMAKATPLPGQNGAPPGTGRQGARGEASPAVWVVQPDGTLRRVEVRLGVRSDQYAEVVSDGLSPGDQLAVAFHREARGTTQRPPMFGGPRYR